MIKIGNYYELRGATHQLIDITENKYTFLNLSTDGHITTAANDYRETNISHLHLQRLGLHNNAINGVFVVPVSTVLGDDLSNLTLAVFGYLVFHQDEIKNVQPRYNEAQNEIHQEFDRNKRISDSFRTAIMEKLNTTFSINKLFHELSEYGINIEERTEIILGK